MVASATKVELQPVELPVDEPGVELGREDTSVGKIVGVVLPLSVAVGSETVSVATGTVVAL
jgi:hypothetical protein